MSVYMTVSLTVERYMSVCRPLTRHRQSWLSTPALVLPPLILSALVTSPNYILFSYQTNTNTTLLLENNQTLSNQFVVDDYIDEVEMQLWLLSPSSTHHGNFLAFHL